MELNNIPNIELSLKTKIIKCEKPKLRTVYRACRRNDNEEFKLYYNLKWGQWKVKYFSLGYEMYFELYKRESHE